MGDLLLRRVALLLVVVAAVAGCSSAPPPPPPERIYTAWLSSPGGEVNWRFIVDGVRADQGTKRPMSTAEAYVELPVRQGQRVTLTAEIATSGFAGCRIVDDNNVEVVPLQQQRLSLDGTAPAAACSFVG